MVKKIEIFTTQIRTGDNKTIIIPNGAVAGGTITNYSTKPTRRLDLVIGVGYDDDLDKVRSVLEDILNADERVLKDPEFTIGVVELADNSVNLVVGPWADSANYWPLHFDLRETIKNGSIKQGPAFLTRNATCICTRLLDSIRYRSGASFQQRWCM